MPQVATPEQLAVYATISGPWQLLAYLASVLVFVGIGGYYAVRAGRGLYQDWLRARGRGRWAR